MKLKTLSPAIIIFLSLIAINFAQCRVIQIDSSISNYSEINCQKDLFLAEIQPTVIGFSYFDQETNSFNFPIYPKPSKLNTGLTKNKIKIIYLDFKMSDFQCTLPLRN